MPVQKKAGNLLNAPHSYNDCQKDKCANCPGNHGAASRDCEVWKKEKDYQIKTYSKYHLFRNEKDSRLQNMQK